MNESLEFIMYALVGLVGAAGVVLLAMVLDIQIHQWKLRKKRLRLNDHIAYNPNHPEVIKYKHLMIDELGLDEYWVENDLDKFETISNLRKINKEIEKNLNSYEKKRKKRERK